MGYRHCMVGRAGSDDGGVDSSGGVPGVGRSLGTGGERSDACRFSMPAAPQSLRAARWAVRDWLSRARWPATAIEDVVIAVNEALSNAVEHAYATPPPIMPTHALVDFHGLIEPAPGHPEVTGLDDGLDRLPWRARMEIVGHGQWRPAHVDRGALHRSLGLQLMRKLMDHVAIETASAGTRITLITFAVLVDDYLFFGVTPHPA